MMSKLLTGQESNFVLDTALSSSLSCAFVTTQGCELSLCLQNATLSQGLVLTEESASAIVVKHAVFSGYTGAF